MPLYSSAQNIRCHQACPELVSYQKKDERVWLRPSLFWYDTNLSKKKKSGLHLDSGGGESFASQLRYYQNTALSVQNIQCLPTCQSLQIVRGHPITVNQLNFAAVKFRGLPCRPEYQSLKTVNKGSSIYYMGSEKKMIMNTVVLFRKFTPIQMASLIG